MSCCGLKIVQTSDCAFEKDLRDRLEDRAQTPPLFCELPGEAHARQGDRFLAAGDCVELAPFEVVGHAGDVGELPLLYRPESSAESPHLSGKQSVNPSVVMFNQTTFKGSETTLFFFGFLMVMKYSPCL